MINKSSLKINFLSICFVVATASTQAQALSNVSIEKNLREEGSYGQALKACRSSSARLCRAAELLKNCTSKDLPVNVLEWSLSGGAKGYFVVACVTNYEGVGSIKTDRKKHYPFRCCKDNKS